MKKEVLRLDHVSVYNHTREALLENVNFTLWEGEINCVLTKENLSKETLINVLQGNCMPNGGHLYVDDTEIVTVRDYKNLLSVSSHISIKPQLVSDMNVAENLFYFNKGVYRHGILDEKAIYKNTRLLMEDFNICDISAVSDIRKLTAAQKHLIEILRAVAGNRRFLILEDFTSIYTINEMKRFMEILTLISQKGISVILFSEKSHGPAKLADRLTILQNRTVTSIHDDPVKALSQAASSGPVSPSFSITKDQKNNAPSFSSACLHTDYIMKHNGAPFSIALERHKITGVFDMDWLYCPELIDILFERSAYSGSLLIDGTAYSLKDNLAVINENLSDDNIFCNMDIWDNIGLLLHSRTLSPMGVKNRRLTIYYIRDILNSLHMEYLIERYSHLAHMPRVSYDIQMDINIAKWVCKKPRFIVFINPYPVNDSGDTLKKFRQVVLSVQDMGISCLIISRNKTLQSICDTVINL